MVQSLEGFKRHKPDIFIIHQTGERDVEMVREAYRKAGIKARVEPFLYDMAQAYVEADMVLSRAGATTLAEITACGKPAILVPYPHATHQHQYRNAVALARAGAAIVVEDHLLNGEVVVEKVLEWMGNPDQMQQMAQKSKAAGNPRATQEIVRSCIELVSGR
jgi:UDP-N-acetylglucosamine--N-acetylmuramyl-(pentapeptide) pyrophosphoryl-undecaprenol N-acetylglucosamine transferase